MKNAFLFAAALCAVAMAHAGENLFPQGDFEKEPKGGWHLPSGEWRVADGAGYKNSRGMIFEVGADPKKVKWPWTVKVPVEPGTRYRFALRVKIDTFKCKSGHLTIGLGWNDANSKGLGSVEAVNQTDNAVGQDGWIRFEGVTPPLPAAAATVFFWIWAPEDNISGRVRFDEFEVEQTVSKPGVLSVHTSAYRDLAAEGDLEVRALYFANPLKYPEKDLRGFFEYVSPAGVKRVAAKIGGDIAEGRIAATDLAEGTHPVKFILETMRGERLGEKAIDFTRVKELPRRKVWIDRHHRAIVDGKPFFPLGMYWSQVSATNIAKYKEGPFNCLMPYHRPNRAQLDLLWKAGLRLMYPAQGGFKGVSAEESLEYARKTAQEFADHPAILAWYICDELPVTLADRLAARNHLLRALDPDHPTWIVLDKPHHVRPFLDGYDVIGMDPYPVGNHGGPDRTEIGIASGWIQEANEATFGFRPSWNVPQVFNWGWYRPEDKRDVVKTPTRAEMRSMAWQSIAAGAKGLVFYSFFDVTTREKDPAVSEKIWQDVLSVAREVDARVPTILSVEEAPSVDLPGATARCAGHAISKELVCRAWKKDGRTWLLACNRTRAKEKTALTLDGETVPLDLGPIDVKWLETAATVAEWTFDEKGNATRVAGAYDLVKNPVGSHIRATH